MSRPVSAGEAPAGISVIVITLNEERNIRDCLESLTALDYPGDRFEILVVDASSDATPAIAASYPKVRVIRAPKGFSSQKNSGRAEARFGILAFTDADCAVPPDWLRVIDRAFRDPHLSVAGGNAFPPPGTRGFALWSACVGHPGGGAIGFDANVTPGPGGIEFVAGCNSAYRRSALDAVGGFAADFLDGGEDLDVSRRIRAGGGRLEYIPDLTVSHKPRPTLGAFWRWNVGVGVTKFNLRRPGPARILLNPFFPVWPALGLAGLLSLPVFPWIQLAVAAAAIPAFDLFLFAATKPYRLLWKRRRTIGVSVSAALIIVPFLVFVRQTAMAVGVFKKWRSR